MSKSKSEREIKSKINIHIKTATKSKSKALLNASVTDPKDPGSIKDMASELIEKYSNTKSQSAFIKE